MGLVIGIDASRNRSGGAKAHLVGLLEGADPRSFGIREVHVWAYKSLMDAIPDFPWLVKHSPEVLEKSLFRQLWWQYTGLPREAREHHCDILFNTDAGSICPYEPGVTMSQDMLSFEAGEMARYGLSKARLRLLALKYVQLHSLRKARAAIFLTDYARTVIGKAAGSLQRTTVINHGIGNEFRRASPRPAASPNRPLRSLYVSNAAMYKHQWHVVDAVSRVRRSGYDISLLLVGGGTGAAQERLERQMRASDPKGEFVKQSAFADHAAIPGYLESSDIFIFASSCENMPITLLEAMAGGLPIVCSNRGPMPEVLGDGGIYFDPEDPASIAEALEKVAADPELRAKIGERARHLAERYSWSRCSSETWAFLAKCTSVPPLS